MSAAVKVSSNSGLRLDELARGLPVPARIVGDASVRVSGVRHDSRSVLPGDLFVARKGQRVDGARFIGDALARGARAVMVGDPACPSVPGHVPIVHVGDVAVAFAHAATLVYGCPSQALNVVGITGTNGKTTTVHLVRAAVDAAVGRPACGVIGTVGHSFGAWQAQAAHTTPEADEVARTMAHMRSSGASHVAMEVSSHAIELGRVQAVRFAVAALTNVTHDHLDFHGSMEAYSRAKARLFTDYGPRRVVLNVDDPLGRELAGAVGARVVRVSSRAAREEDADVFPRQSRIHSGGVEATVRTPSGDVEIASRLLGDHNLDNLLLALGIAEALELDVGRAASALSREPAPPGRFERCDGPGDAITVLVDYAHTPDALARALHAARAVAPRRVWCVFGCGGDRDPTKRFAMGEAAARGADEVIVTSDNPRGEEPATIARAVAEGARAAGTVPVIELDRRTAIERAVASACDGDVVLVAGKGHETYQQVGALRHPFDDRQVAREALAHRRAQPRDP
jgi:UDP-N-acetylmuramoyl-L-alanyl-D-glutamate--2,6-diaminopimelate ligase